MRMKTLAVSGVACIRGSLRVISTTPLRRIPHVLSEQEASIGVDSSERGKDHHTVPVREIGLCDVRKDELPDLVSKAHAPVAQEREQAGIMYDRDATECFGVEPGDEDKRVGEEWEEAEQRRKDWLVGFPAGDDHIPVAGPSVSLVGTTYALTMLPIVPRPPKTMNPTFSGSWQSSALPFRPSVPSIQ